MMKTITLFLTVLLINLTAFAQVKEGVDITVTIENVSNNEGKVLVSLHNQDTFMKGPGVKNLESDIEDGKVSVTFENVPKGTYAIMAMHDANDNKRMDYEPNGMPKESYGMSGNDMTMGPPVFDNAKFEVGGEDLKFDIRF